MRTPSPSHPPEQRKAGDLDPSGDPQASKPANHEERLARQLDDQLKETKLSKGDPAGESDRPPGNGPQP